MGNKSAQTSVPDKFSREGVNKKMSTGQFSLLPPNKFAINLLGHVANLDRFFYLTPLTDLEHCETYSVFEMFGQVSPQTIPSLPNNCLF